MSPAPLLRVRGLAKSYPGVRALDGVDLEVRAGEIVALVGENGAGKSTLLRLVSGAASPDAGTIELCGRSLAGLPPAAVARAGVATIYQELSLVPQLSVRANLFLGRETGATIDAAAERRRAAEVLARLGARVDPETPARRLDVARQQLVEIARALLVEAPLLVMDEPTASLTPSEVERLFEILRELRAGGLGVIFVSHRLDEVLAIADRIVVLRDGRLVGSHAASELSRGRLIELMVGRSLDQEFPRRRPAPGAPLLEVRGLSGGRVRDASFVVGAGEILGVAGLVGAGRTELARLVFGADRAESGEVLVAGKAAHVDSPGAAIASGIALLTEDRKGQGLVLALPARDNFALGNLARWSRAGVIDARREDEAFAGHVERLGIRLAHPLQPAGTLSGGNQQKLLVARWLEHDARVLIFDEPTRGIDVGARRDIHALLDGLAARGKAILMISSELPEVLGMSDRILVMRDGRISGTIADAARATPESVLALAVP